MRNEQLCISVQQRTKYPIPGRHASHDYHFTIILRSPRRSLEPSGLPATLVTTPPSLQPTSVSTQPCSAFWPLSARMSLPKVVSSSPPQLPSPVVMTWTVTSHVQNFTSKHPALHPDIPSFQITYSDSSISGIL